VCVVIIVFVWSTQEKANNLWVLPLNTQLNKECMLHCLQMECKPANRSIACLLLIFFDIEITTCAFLLVFAIALPSITFCFAYQIQRVSIPYRCYVRYMVGWAIIISSLNTDYGLTAQ